VCVCVCATSFPTKSLACVAFSMAHGESVQATLPHPPLPISSPLASQNLNHNSDSWKIGDGRQLATIWGISFLYCSLKNGEFRHPHVTFPGFQRRISNSQRERDGGGLGGAPGTRLRA
jgi:hypothetical protein